jgi:hypothetical protein
MGWRGAVASGLRPSMVVIMAPSHCRMGTRQELTSSAFPVSPVHQDGAGAALAFAAAFLGAGEVEVLAEDVEQALHRRGVDGAGFVVDGENDALTHRRTFQMSFAMRNVR